MDAILRLERRSSNGREVRRLRKDQEEALSGFPAHWPTEFISRTIPSGFEEAACRLFKKYNGNPPMMSLHDFLSLFERAIIFGTLANLNGCQRSAARFLKLKNTTLNRKVKVQKIRFAKIPLLPVEAEKKLGIQSYSERK